ncbi:MULTISPECIES: fumarylacetoacetase [Streptomyces]|uniref:fumarylacetoacetase n=1 Tax=Streptomyces TaxID=1883 RepID=UPI000F7ABD80|nr:fumarylacetoacetase [Streptomyces sp. WAC05858]RSS43266.1 fumarylacetoacetase [Streptomyces sp. WAC05858]WTA83230.1 fumarylacetoacetase [Streptomyces antimycoticus]WTB06291.1 fumarylacetoacetase [Streptomyces antimycoticus]
MPQRSPLDLPEGDPFGPHNLPYGVFTTPHAPHLRKIGVRYGNHVLDAGAAAAAAASPHAEQLGADTLNPLMAAGRPVWQAVRAEVLGWLTDPAHRSTIEPLMHPLPTVALHLPFEVADYADFYASEHHATNAGRIFRPDGEALSPNWKHMPIGYHGRAGTLLVSGTPIVRPQGQHLPPADTSAPPHASSPTPVFGPSLRLDFEAEVAFVVGAPSTVNTPVGLSGFHDHVFGVCLLNDWSARDIQAWEYRPLGPFLGKSFATSLAAWVTPLEALTAARTSPPARDVPLLPYLDDSAAEPGGLDLRLEVALNGHTVSRPPFSAMYWTAAQQLAHLTVNGASLRTGDVFASGTVSGPRPDELGCLLELTWGGRQPLRLPDSTRTFLEDGDEVTITAWAPGPQGVRIGLGEVTGQVVPATP